MELAKLVSTVRSLGLAKREVNFLKNYTFHSDTHTIGVDTISDDQRRNNDPRGGKEFKKQTNKKKKRLKFAGIAGRKYHTQVAANPAMPSVMFVAKRDILENFASLLISRSKKQTEYHMGTSQKIEMNILALW